MIVILSRPLTEAIESHNTWIRNRGSLHVGGVSVESSNCLVETVESGGVFAGVEESGGDESNEH